MTQEIKHGTVYEVTCWERECFRFRVAVPADWSVGDAALKLMGGILGRGEMVSFRKVSGGQDGG